MSRLALIIDDNDDYAAMLLAHLEPRGFQFARARNSPEALNILQRSNPDSYELIITDITMGSQTAGLRLLRQIRRRGYRGVLIVASTGFDSPFILHLARVFLKLLSADILIPKRPLKAGQMRCYPITLRGKFWEATHLT